MRVALFTDTYTPQINGVTNTLQHLVRYYEEQGIEYRIYSPDYYSGYKTHYEDNEQWVEKFFSLKLFLYPECRLALPNPFRLHASISKFKPDLIHLMTEWNMGFAGLQLGKRFSIPTVSSYTTNFTQYAAYYKADFLKQPVWEYLKWFHNENEITLCPSNEARNFILKNGIKNTAIFSRGIDLGQFHPSNRSDRFKREYDLQETFTFLYVGRVSPEKDLDLLNLSYRAMKGRYGDSISLVITGDGPYLEKYRGLFPKDVVFTGFKTGKDIAEIYASADAFVCTSSTETFGNVILEAMASGLPVIGADAGGIKEIIQHGENGLKFTARDYESLELAMEMIFLDESLRSALIAGSIETVERRSWTHVFSELSKVYESVKHEKIKQAISA